MPFWKADLSKYSWLAAGLLAAFGWGVLSRVDVPSDSSYAICFFRRIFDFPCPGCGLTRAFAFLAKGQLNKAVDMQPLSPVFVLEAALLWVYWGLIAFRRCKPPADSAVRLGAWLHLHALLSVWIARALSGNLPA